MTSSFAEFVSDDEPGVKIYVPTIYIYDFVSTDQYVEKINSLIGAEKRIAIKRSPSVIGAFSVSTIVKRLLFKTVKKSDIFYRELEDNEIVETETDLDYLARSSVALKYLDVSNEEFASLKRERKIRAFVSEHRIGGSGTYTRKARMDVFLLAELNDVRQSLGV